MKRVLYKLLLLLSFVIVFARIHVCKILWINLVLVIMYFYCIWYLYYVLMYYICLILGLLYKFSYWIVVRYLILESNRTIRYVSYWIVLISQNEIWQKKKNLTRASATDFDPSATDLPVADGLQPRRPKSSATDLIGRCWVIWDRFLTLQRPVTSAERASATDQLRPTHLRPILGISDRFMHLRPAPYPSATDLAGRRWVVLL